MNQTAIQDFRARLRGEMLLPSHAGYEEGRRIYNAMIDRRPSLIVRCASTEDVVAAVQFAREHSLPVSVKGAGHNVAGNAVCEGGVMIDCSRLKGIAIDTAQRTATAQAGLTLGDFDKGTTEHGLFTTMGVVSKTGIAGLTLGGGLGWLMGKFGLACDNLIGAEVVTAEGKVLRADEQENPDLLWGLRGGGGNFGIVTRFEYRLHPMEPFLGGLILYSGSELESMLRCYRERVAACPDELTLYAAMQDLPDGTPACGFGVAYCGEPAAGESAVAPLRKFGKPLADTVALVPYVQHQAMFDEAYPPGLYHYWKANMMGQLSDEAIGLIAEYFRTRPSPLSQMFFEYIHGAASRVAPEATAFAHRSERFNFSVFVIWRDPREAEANLAWLQKFWRDMQPHFARGVYVNYLSQEGAERVREAYGPNYERLAALKQQYDPTNFFRLNQNIAPKAGAAGND
ncbi:MAG: FAD-binding oxidoreductase [Acidobacteriota bacterium]